MIGNRANQEYIHSPPLTRLCLSLGAGVPVGPSFSTLFGRAETLAPSRKGEVVFSVGLPG
jgi:hypothetical protein